MDHIPKAVKGKVGEIMASKVQRDNVPWAMSELDLEHVADRDVEVLSGGELQRFAIAVVVIQTADVYMFDEPSSYLDVKQRLKAALVIRSLVGTEEGLNRYVSDALDSQSLSCDRYSSLSMIWPSLTISPTSSVVFTALLRLTESSQCLSP